MSVPLLRRMLLMVVVLTLAGGAALRYWRLPQIPVSPIRSIPCADPVAGCDLFKEKLHIAFDRHPRVMQPFHIALRMPEARAVHASFEMRDMQMGVNRYRFVADGRGGWQAEVILPVCMQGRSDWVLRLDVDDQRFRLNFSVG